MARKLDALVAERVMGEHTPVFIPHDPSTFLTDIRSENGNWYLTSDYEAGDVPYWCPLPFSTNIAAAWMVVEKLREQSIAVTVSTMGPRAETGVHTTVCGTGSPHTWAESAPLAICLAALKAVGVDQGVIDDALKQNCVQLV
jgi:hypothetical protein